MRKLLGFMGLMGLMGLLPVEPLMPIKPSQHVLAQDTNRLSLHIDGSTFFIDNEYFGDRISGYTLPGFVLQPKVEWWLGGGLTLQGGVHWLYYWGARDYPATTAYGAYPVYDSVARPVHLLPWLQAEYSFTPQLKLVLGCLNAYHHHLPMPMYNPELGIVGDPETGFELNYSSRLLDMDIWTDWREYIWDRSPVPERFTAGASGELRFDIANGWGAMYVPLHFVVQHEGGQNMSVDHNINNNFNGATGLGMRIHLRSNIYTEFSCRAFWYHQHGNAAVTFSNGWGLYPEIIFHPNSHWSLAASYWQGKDYVPLLGSWHFSNLSANTPGLTFDRTRVVMLYANWGDPVALKSHYLRLYCTLYHYLPSIGTFADGSTREYGHRNQLSFGAVLSFFPNIKLH